MPATAFTAVTVRGKNEARKIRNMAAISPTPNQRILIGIQASGEIGRRIWIKGFKAISDRLFQPSANPKGMAKMAAPVKPQVTRNNDATTYFNNSPRCASSTMPRATARGVGNKWTFWYATAICQTTRSIPMNTTGRSRTVKFIVEDFSAKSSDDLNACAGRFLVAPWITKGFFIDDFCCRSRLPSTNWVYTTPRSELTIG